MMHKSTKAIHGGNPHRSHFGEVSVPIFQTSTFSFSCAEEGAARFSGESSGYVYTRLGNPTVNALEENMTALESGWRGMATATGMAAVTTVFLSLLEQGTHVVSTDSLYGPTRVVLETIFKKLGIESTFVDTSDLSQIENAVRPSTRIIYLETPANPTMKLSDIAGAASIAHRRGAVLAVDNTFASPFLQRPLEQGADIVVHSLTKYVNGHSDVLGGMIITGNQVLFEKIRPVLNLVGGTMDPHQAWLILRGVRTLPLRVERSQENALKLARFLKEHPMVTWVSYPGLPDHPHHELARKQMDGFGGMIAFGVQGGLDGGRIVMNSVRLFTLAVSLGGVESLIEHSASMTHASIPEHERTQAGILNELVRISVGCEDFEDLRDDLDQALNRIPLALAAQSEGEKDLDELMNRMDE
jgi:methionine-gamma-lyase